MIKKARNPEITVRSLVELFNCGKTQISYILKNKDSILALYESNASTSKQGRASKLSDVNLALYQWYCLACSKNVYPSGQLVEKSTFEMKKALQCEEIRHMW